MKKIILLVFILSAVLGCQIARTDSIEGTWQATHALGIPVSGGYYYQFKSDDTYSRDTLESDLYKTGADMIGTYSLTTKGDLTITPNAAKSFTDEGFSFTAYILGNYMYWYLGAIEAVRLERR